MTKIQNKDILKSVPLLASVLGNQYNVNVLIGGDKAMTDGNTIYIPSLPINSNDEFLGLLRGFIDHESAHIRYTDFKLAELNVLTDLEKYVWNCIEDWRIEQKISSRYTGCKANFYWLAKHFFYDNYKPQKKKTLQKVIPEWLLLKIRSWDVEILEKQILPLEKYLKKTSPKLLTELGALLLEVKAQCESTAEALEHAKRIVACIEKYSKQDPINQQDKSELTEKAEQTEQSQQNENIEQSNSDEQNQQLNQDEQSQLPKQAQGENQNDATTTETLSVSKTLSTTSDINDLLSSDSRYLPHTLGEKVGKTLERNREKDADNRIYSASVGSKPCDKLDDTSLHRAKKVSNALKARLQGLLQAQGLARDSPASRGKLNKSRLHELGVNNSKVFLRQNKKTITNCAVHILWDISGSMGSKIREASEACYALASALENTKGINIAVTAFPIQHTMLERKNSNENKQVYPLVEHGKKVHTYFDISSGGCTPLTESLWWVLPRLLAQKEDRKIILLITDGEPDNKISARKALEYANKFGIEVYGVALEPCSIDDLLPNTSVTLQGVHELPQAMFGILQSALINK